MSTLLICLAVVGVAIAVVSWTVVRGDGAGQDATDPIKTAYAPPARAVAASTAPVVEYDTTSIWRRLRSGVFLIVLLAFLGALTAVLVLVGGAIAITGLRNAVQ